MAEGTINISILRAEIAKSRAIDVAALNVVKFQFDKAKRVMLGEFDDDKVTEEIKEGEKADNITGTLANYNSDRNENGNLFSFLGFPQGTDPTVKLRKFLQDSTTLNTIPVFNQQDSRLTFRFTAKVPTKEDIMRETPVTGWGIKLSWVDIIEGGTDGFFNHYLFKEWQKGRSTMGVQIKHEIRHGDFIPREYTSKIVGDFVSTVGTSVY